MAQKEFPPLLARKQDFPNNKIDIRVFQPKDIVRATERCASCPAKVNVIGRGWEKGLTVDGIFFVDSVTMRCTGIGENGRGEMSVRVEGNLPAEPQTQEKIQELLPCGANPVDVGESRRVLWGGNIPALPGDSPKKNR